ncbi:MAG: response regulator transcription factor [Burkholderiaceae bacterium]
MFLLLVEDEGTLAESLSGVLVAKGHRVDWVADGQMALSQLATTRYDAMVLDLGLPYLDGRGVLEALRTDQKFIDRQDLPVLILSARDQSIDKIAALDAGADDYLSKPFDVNELEARLFALLRRRLGKTGTDLNWAGIRFDATKRIFFCENETLNLSPREHAALLALLQAQGEPLSRQALFERVFADDEAALSVDAIDVVVYRLRKKLTPLQAQIHSVRGVGLYLESIPT